MDFSANINPVQAVDLSCLLKVQLTPYADPDYSSLKQAINQRYPTPEGIDIELFNGASAAIFALLRSLQPKDLVLYAPLYGEYAHIAGELGCKVHNINRFNHLMADVPEHSTVIFVNPSTPDGQLYELQDLLARWQAADCTIIIDESFLDFSTARDGGRDCSRQSSAFPPSMEVRSVAIGMEPMRPKVDSVAQHITHYDKLYVIKSLSKFYGCAGVRIGFVLAEAAAIKELKRLEPAWKLSSLDMAYMQQALANTAFIEQTRQQTTAFTGFAASSPARVRLVRQDLSGAGQFSAGASGKRRSFRSYSRPSPTSCRRWLQLQTLLEPSRILIRVCDNFAGLDKSHVRFAVKDEQAIARLSRSLKEIRL